MSTRCNVIIKDRCQELVFYRHSDGYPKVVLPSLEKFLGLVKEGRIRDNVEQASGWLIRLGATEYKVPENPTLNSDYQDWKVGAYEPSVGIHGDVDYIYVVDLHEKTIQYEGKGSSFVYLGQYSDHDEN